MLITSKLKILKIAQFSGTIKFNKLLQPCATEHRLGTLTSTGLLEYLQTGKNTALTWFTLNITSTVICISE